MKVEKDLNFVMQDIVVKVNIVINKQMYEELCKLAKKEFGTKNSFSCLIRNLFKEYIERKRKGE